jgi:secernin
VEHAIEKGWCRSQEDFDFARCYSDRLYTTFSMAHPRQSRTTDLLKRRLGQITVAVMIDALRDHGEGHQDSFNPAQSSMASVCMHAANELTRSSQSVGSMVAHLNGNQSTLWLTGTSAPCTSVFKPVALSGTVLPDHRPQAGAAFDPASLWWRHEPLHRALLRGYNNGHALYAQERDALEETFLSEVSDLMVGSAGAGPSAADWEVLSQRCFDRATRATDEWIERVAQITASRRIPMPFDLYWRKQARQAKFVL